MILRGSLYEWFPFFITMKYFVEIFQDMMYNKATNIYHLKGDVTNGQKT